MTKRKVTVHLTESGAGLNLRILSEMIARQIQKGALNHANDYQHD